VPKLLCNTVKMPEQLPPGSRRDAGVGTPALVVFDPTSGAISYVNGAATALFDLRDDRLPETRVAELLPELANLAPRTFTSVLRNRRIERELVVRLEHLKGGSFARVGAMLATIEVTATAAPAEPDHRRDPKAVAPVEPLPPPEPAPVPQVAILRTPSARLESRWHLVVRGGVRGSEHVRAVLLEGARGLQMENASLARLEGDELVVEFAEPLEEAGTRTSLDRSVARAALRRSGTFAVLDTNRDREFAFVAPAIRSFLSAAFRIGDNRWVLTFSSARPRESPFGDEDWRYVDDLIEALSRGIERRESDAAIERLAYSDALTSLPNRIALLRRLDEAIAEADALEGRAAVLFLDIDGFKGVNDTVGHRGGDTVLAEVAERLRGTLRREEYIGRLGGDEFAIVMPRVVNRTEIESIAQRIAGVLTFPFGVEDYRFSLSASIGVAIYPDDAADRDDLLACADAAMYAAKDDGGSRVRFRDAVGGFENGIVEATNALGGERREAGYLLCYQPILELATGRISSVEALIRRVHPLHGLLAPERGWSIARDENGRRALDRWVLREAATQARSWAAAGIPVRIDVNLAAFDLREIDALLEDPELAQDARRLRIELAPEQFADSEQAAKILGFVQHCAQNGIGLALDGFDGGLGTLASLASLPIDAIKLDRPLIEGVGSSRTSRAVVEGSIIVAKSLGWSVIAKGVENGAQQDALVALGCDAVQGFFIAHPMTAVDLGTWLRERRYVGREA
jgi:diguanylate cyclase (GGDEF)-like protein